jgi:membrane-associated phospholipid phosphatase
MMDQKRKAVATIESADIAITKQAGAYRHSAPVKLLGQFGKLGDQPPLVALSLATIAAAALLRNMRLARAGGRMLVSHALATATKGVVKHSVDRTRPNMLVDEGRYELAPGLRDESQYNSFPSGHTAGAVAVARAIAREYPAAGSSVYAAAGVIAAIQIPRCHHFASDVAAGALIGWAAEAAVDAVIPATAPKPA